MATPAADPSLKDKLEAWCAAMQETPRRRIVINNLAYDCAEGRLPRSVVRDLLKGLSEAWSTAGEGTAPDALIVRIADGAPAAYLCRGHNDALEHKDCSRVVDAFSWAKETLSAVKLGGAPLEDEISDRMLRAFEREFPLDKVRDDRRWVRGGRAFAWVTQTAAIDGLLDRLSGAQRAKGRGALATLARDTLGLRHYNDDQKMIEIRYPSGVPGGGQLAPPTFIEGSPGLIYRSQKSADGWGMTVDLTTLAAGLPEAVHPPVELTAEFRISYLGSIEGRKEDVTWERLEELCPRRYEAAEIVELLYSIAGEDP